MDFKESVFSNTGRHPWEIAKAWIACGLMERIFLQNAAGAVLDVGCGDCYYLNILKEKYGDKYSLCGFDIKAPRDFIDRCAQKGINLCTGHGELDRQGYDFILAMDILEHLDDDERFLKDIVDNYARENAYFLITAPAFPFLYASHDKFLEHKRRYDKRGLRKLAEKCGLKEIECGWFFFSLLVFRFFEVMLEKVFKHKNEGIGGWRHGKLTTKIAVLILRTDYFLTRIIGKTGFKIPGLSIYMLCAK